MEDAVAPKNAFLKKGPLGIGSFNINWCIEWSEVPFNVRLERPIKNKKE